MRAVNTKGRAGRRKIFATAYDVEAFSAFTLRGVAPLQPACGLARKRSPVGVRKWPSSRSRPVLGTEDSCRLSAPRQNDGTLHRLILQRKREMAPRKPVSCYNSAAIIPRIRPATAGSLTAA